MVRRKVVGNMAKWSILYSIFDEVSKNNNCYCQLLWFNCNSCSTTMGVLFKRLRVLICKYH